MARTEAVTIGYDAKGVNKHLLKGGPSGLDVLPETRGALEAIADWSPDAIEAAIKAGYRHIDTASGYQNEQAVGVGIGAGLAATGLTRGDLFVTAKLWPGNPAWGDQPKNGVETIAECDASLARLGLDYVDLYLIHAPYGGPERVAQ